MAKAWTNPTFKRRLLTNSTAALSELGLEYDQLIVVENTDAVHNLVVCTLCSCYPWPVLGFPPNWYKSPAYRARAVSEPCGLLKELGLEVPSEREIRVWDSSSEMRYMVLPQKPDGVDGFTEERLLPLITRDSLIGVATPLPAGGA